MMILLYSVVYYSGLLVFPFVTYSIFFRKSERSRYSNKDWLYPLKFLIAKRQVKKYQDKFRMQHENLREKIETGFDIPTVKHTNSHHFCGTDQIGNSLLLRFSIGPAETAELSLQLNLANGNSYVLPGKNSVLQTNLSKKQWSGGGAKIEVLEVHRKLRITFNGLLKNISHTLDEKIEHVQFHIIFTAASSPNYIPEDIDETLLANALATKDWKDASWADNLVDQSGFIQFGAMKGFIRGDSYPEEYVLNLPACRAKSNGVDDKFLADRMMKVFVVDAYGNLFNLILKSFTNGCSQMTYGFAYLSNNKRYPIENVDIRLKDIAPNKILPEVITTHMTVKGKGYKCVLHLNTTKTVKFKSNYKYGYESFTVPAECDLNLNQGRAMVEFWYHHEGTDMLILERKLSPKMVGNPPSMLVSNIRNKESQILEITGGKGNSLALLASLNSEHFIVPDGFIVTTQAFKLQLVANPALANSISIITDICCGKLDGNLKEACQDAINHFKNGKILSSIGDAIIEEMKKYAGGEGVPSWAVRSSAIGEDSEELSAAGQNETLLGCQNEEQILQAVLACWASLYTYQSVQYRWQHGLSIQTDMAVVVQKMVPADCAGVLFTCHPSTSNPSQMVITSNFGLGETVVSGSSDPDTFILKRSWDNKIEVLNKNVGGKKSILAMTSDGSTEMYEEKDNNESWSLTDAQALQLGQVGVLLERAFGSPRDIEWAYYKDKLYLLQSRPITTLNTWTDFEIDHEMDTPLLTDKTVLTVANVREVVPRAATVLAQTSCILCVNKAMQIQSQKNSDPISQIGVITFQHSIMLDVVTSIHRNVSKEVQMSSKILDLAIFGHSILDEKLNEMLVNKIGVCSLLDDLKEICRIFGYCRKNSETLDEAKRLVDNLKLGVKKQEPLSATYRRIDDALDDVYKVAVCHTKTTSVSVFYQVIIMTILLERKNELTMEHLSDFALILSSCNDVVSAEVPKLTEEIAKQIKVQPNADEFCELKPELGGDWLKIKCPEIKKLLDTFLEKHGHRSAGEFEVMEESWAENPSKVISMIQANIKHKRSAVKGGVLPADIVKNLVSPKSVMTRKIIQFPIKKMRIAVAVREETKSQMVRAMDKVRQAYRHLSQEMVWQGLLPSKDLIYHLTHEEIGQIIQCRNPVLINKAMRRRKLYPKWDELKFPEIMFGVPLPEDNSTIEMKSLEEFCRGTPVCTGLVQARACVINTLDEIHQLQTGDILITYSTDIGWSPYFPMLSGIVTELGGLISHGAVVAREYGLPCIVGMKSVTKYFKTGDTVLLNGKTGELGRL